MGSDSGRWKPPADPPASLVARLASIAHEIGTPIALASAAAGGALEEAARLAESPGAGPNVRAHAARIRGDLTALQKNLDRAATLLASYRRAAASEGLQGARLDFDLAAVVRDAVETVAPALRRSDVRADVRAETPVPVTADPGAVTQVVVNLVLNAVQHAFRGAIRKRVDVIVRAEEGAAVVEVRDNGRGIPGDILPQIFEPFFTTDAVHGGSGLGLAVVRDLVENRLKGSISCTSEPEQGTTFRIRIGVKP